MNKTWVIASHNEKKRKEMETILSALGIAVQPLPQDAPEPVEDGKTFEENAVIKARSAMQWTGLPAIADDSGLCVGALDGAPGIFSARYCEGSDADRNAFLLRNMADRDDRRCRFVCAIACVWPEKKEDALVVRGECEGELLREEKGAGGFGYDPLFYVPEYGCTFGELPAEVKNEISHRGRALRKLREELESRL